MNYAQRAAYQVLMEKNSAYDYEMITSGKSVLRLIWQVIN